jgi:hypothetical protein
MTRRAGTYLPMPTDGCNTAEQCRQMGLNIGDTITGREHAGRRSDAWHEARLTLLWIGRQECMWLVQTRTHDQPLWTDPEEDGNWELDGRRWRLTPLPVSMETPQ